MTLISATFVFEDELFQWQRTFSSHCCSLDVVKGFEHADSRTHSLAPRLGLGHLALRCGALQSRSLGRLRADLDTTIRKQPEMAAQNWLLELAKHGMAPNVPEATTNVRVLTVVAEVRCGSLHTRDGNPQPYLRPEPRDLQPASSKRLQPGIDAAPRFSKRSQMAFSLVGSFPGLGVRG